MASEHQGPSRWMALESMPAQSNAVAPPGRRERAEIKAGSMPVSCHLREVMGPHLTNSAPWYKTGRGSDQVVKNFDQRPDLGGSDLNSAQGTLIQHSPDN